MSRVTIVTGGGSGIGLATVERLAKSGGRVVVVDLNTDDVRESESVRVVRGDVTDADTYERAVHSAENDFGGLDAAVLNAGVSASGDLLELPMEVFDRTIEVNVRAVLLGMRAVVPSMRRRGGGRIAVTASTSGIAADPGMWPYNSAKAAVINLVRAAALDLARDAITVNAICPGPTETGMTRGIRGVPEVHGALARSVPLQRWGQADEIAAVIEFAVSADASFLTGAVIPVDGGVTANTGQFAPAPLDERN